MEKENLIKPPKTGEIMEGKVIAKESGKLFLDLGPIGTGIIYGKEFYEAKDKIKELKIEDLLFAKVISLENEDGYIELSISKAGIEMSFEALRRKKEEGEKILVKILGANKGGLISEIMGIPAFLPVSQLMPENYPRVEKGDTAKILKELQKFVGKELEVKILDLSQKGEQIILSEKAKESDKVKEILSNYKIGDVVDGEITGITDFGAFMRFPVRAAFSAKVSPATEAEKTTADKGDQKLEGLIHISEMDWKIVEDPAEIVKVGEKLQAKIIDISENKVSLSLKALKKDPWLNSEKKFKKGETVSGKVTKFNPFGAFIQLSPEIQGLCHISEFGLREKMEEKLKIGEEYDFQILEIRPEEHRMSLKLVAEESAAEE